MSDDLDKRVGRFYKQIGQGIRDARVEAHLTQSQLGDAVGLTRTSITNLEAGRQHIPLHVVARIAAVLKVPARDLFPEDSVFDDPIVMPDLSKPLADADERMRSFVQTTVAKVALPSRPGKTA